MTRNRSVVHSAARGLRWHRRSARGTVLSPGMTRAAHAPLRPQMVQPQCAPSLNDRWTVRKSFRGTRAGLVVGGLVLQPPGNLLGGRTSPGFSSSTRFCNLRLTPRGLLRPQGRNPSSAIGILVREAGRPPWRGRSPWRPSRLSCPGCRSASLGFGLAAEEVSAWREPQVAATSLRVN